MEEGMTVTYMTSWGSTLLFPDEVMTNALIHGAYHNNNSSLSRKHKHETLAEVIQEKPSSVVPLGEIGALLNGLKQDTYNFIGKFENVRLYQ